MYTKIALIGLIMLCLAGLTYAEIKDVGFENKHTFRIATRSDGDDYDLYITRAEGRVDYYLPAIEKTIKFLPFFEYQSNFDTDTWWRKELGAEIGASFFNDFFYYGASFQHVWQKPENYTVEELTETTEWESRFVFTIPVRWGIFKEWEIFKDKVRLRCFDEYTYDFSRGQATVNDVGVVLDWQVLKNLRLPIGWRHSDRVHDFDSDALEFSVVFSF